MSVKLTNFPLTATISSAQGQISSELSGEAVILNMNSGVYYGLNAVGARIWELIQQQSYSFDQLHSTLLEEYDVASAACEQDLIRILSDLKAAGLIEVSDEAS